MNIPKKFKDEEKQKKQTRREKKKFPSLDTDLFLPFFFLAGFSFKTLQVDRQSNLPSAVIYIQNTAIWQSPQELRGVLY